MFLLYSGVKTVHQKPSQLLLIQTLRLSVKFISNILFIYLSSLSHRTVSICTGKVKNTKKCTTIEDRMLLMRMPPSLHHLLSPVSVYPLVCWKSALWRKLSEPSLFPWHLSLSNQRWRPESSCSAGKSSEWWLQQSERGRRNTEKVSNPCSRNTKRTMISKLTLRPCFPMKVQAVHFLDTSCPTCSLFRSSSLSGELLGRGWVVKPTAWVITAVITAFLVTLQANAMWKRLIHGSQVLNTATPPAVAVIPPCGLWPPATSFSVPTTGTPVCGERRRVQKGGGVAVITWGSNTGCG